MTDVSRRLRVLIYGNVDPATGGSCYARSVGTLGHEARTYSDRTGLGKYRTNLALRILNRLIHRVRESDRRAHVAGLAAEVERVRPDVLLATGGHYLSADDVRGFRARGVWVANVHHDDFFSRYRTSWTWTQRLAIPSYDWVFTTRTVNVGEVRPLNPNVSFLSFSYDPAVHRPVLTDAERPAWASDVVFVGGWAKHRAGVIEKLVRAVPADYAFYGPGWHRVRRSSPVFPYVRGRSVWGDDLARALGGAKVALGFLRKENRDDYTQRTFEIPACGGVLLAERTAKHASIYREGVEAEFFDADDPDELAAKVRGLLADDARREAIRAAGAAAVSRGGYTYDDRVREILDVYRSRGGRPPVPADCVPAPRS